MLGETYNSGSYDPLLIRPDYSAQTIYKYDNISSIWHSPKQTYELNDTMPHHWQINKDCSKLRFDQVLSIFNESADNFLPVSSNVSDTIVDVDQDFRYAIMQNSSNATRLYKAGSSFGDWEFVSNITVDEFVAEFNSTEDFIFLVQRDGLWGGNTSLNILYNDLGAVYSIVNSYYGLDNLRWVTLSDDLESIFVLHNNYAYSLFTLN